MVIKIATFPINIRVIDHNNLCETEHQNYFMMQKTLAEFYLLAGRKYLSVSCKI